MNLTEILREGRGNTEYKLRDMSEDKKNNRKQNGNKDDSRKEMSAGRDEYKPLGEPADNAEDRTAENERMDALEKYSYFDAYQIINSASIPNDTLRKGQRLFNQGMFSRIDMIEGYDSNIMNGDELGQATWTGSGPNAKIRTTVTFSKTALLNASCNCPACQKRRTGYWYYGEQKSKCEYVAGLLYAVQAYLSDNNFGDATDRMANDFLNLCQSRRTNTAKTDSESSENKVMLKPRLVKKDGKLTVSFRIGTGKMLLIKQLGEFCDNVKNGATAIYGSDTKINHSRSNFTEESLKWLRFIEQIVQEEEEFNERMNEAVRLRNRYYYYRKPTDSVGGSLNLFGWRLDEFYQVLGDEKVDYEDRDSAYSQKLKLSAGTGNPPFSINISEEIPKTVKKPAEFEGIRVSGQLPELFYGTDLAYYVDDTTSTLKCSDRDFRDKIEPLTPFIDDYANFSFVIGRNRMAEFYYDILPSLADIAQITEKDPDRIHAFLAPRVNFVFYLDSDENDVYCAPFAYYGDKEFTLLDNLSRGHEKLSVQYRDYPREQEILYVLRKYFPAVDPDRKELTTDGDESLIYLLMAEGVDELLSYGEVRCTNRFRRRMKVRKVNASVGVSVSEGLLELDISSKDLSMQELLDILQSYRAKKTYYKLKDGSYVDLEDQSLEMLSELMDSMNLKPKDFVSGKMHLPLYRTLYLNKMLEENENIYAERDSHFRQIVKEFKAVNDADFDVPESLSGIMREYQKDGYRWLRLLETYKFGGILADDMGLGKTLQIISVLLAAKERCKEGEKMSALIVVPASVVYNWGDEFTRFAPQLEICLVTGTQAERREKISHAADHDVLVTSYDLLKRDIDQYEDIKFTYEIIDEAQYIKNHTTAAAKAVKVIKSTYRFALTGTPIENRLSELWSIFDFLMPGFLYSYDVFRRDIETPIVKYGDEDAMKRLQKMTSPFILRRLKGNVLKDLPEKLEEVRMVRFGKEQQKLYDAQVVRMRRDISGQTEEEFDRNKFMVLAELTKLRQICCDPSLCFEDYYEGSAKLDACMDLVNSAIDGGHRILLFSQFTSMLDILQRRLDQEGISYYTIVGSTPKEKRLQLAKSFNEGAVPVFLISLKAGGVGLNLTGADVVIHYDPWWNIAAENQATDRAHRIGQDKKVTEYKLIMKDSVEEKILNLQYTKRDLADQVINGETGNLGSMTREDLLEILGG